MSCSSFGFAIDKIEWSTDGCYLTGICPDDSVVSYPLCGASLTKFDQLCTIGGTINGFAEILEEIGITAVEFNDLIISCKDAVSKENNTGGTEKLFNKETCEFELLEWCKVDGVMTYTNAAGATFTLDTLGELYECEEEEGHDCLPRTYELYNSADDIKLFEADLIAMVGDVNLPNGKPISAVCKIAIGTQPLKTKISSDGATFMSSNDCTIITNGGGDITHSGKEMDILNDIADDFCVLVKAGTITKIAIEFC